MKCLFYTRPRHICRKHLKSLTLLIYSHCTGLGPVQGPNGTYCTMLKCWHWSKTGVGIVNHCFLLCQSHSVYHPQSRFRAVWTSHNTVVRIAARWWYQGPHMTAKSWLHRFILALWQTNLTTALLQFQCLIWYSYFGSIPQCCVTCYQRLIIAISNNSPYDINFTAYFSFTF